VFSRRKTMMYTLEVGSNIFTNLRRHRGLDFHFIVYSRVDTTSIYTPSSTVKDGDYRVVEIRILKSGRKYQPKLIINIISQRYKSCGETHTTYTETRNVCTDPNPLAVISGWRKSIYSTSNKCNLNFITERPLCILIIGLIPFLWNIFSYTSTVRAQQECDFSILGRNACKRR